MDLAMQVFTLTRGFPAEERFSLVDQIRRASRSVPANISEAWRKRRYEAAFISKLNDAEGEAAETQTHLEIARRCGYITAVACSTLDERYERILAQLVTMSTQPEQWIVTPSPRPQVPLSHSHKVAPPSVAPSVAVSPSPKVSKSL